MSTGWDGRRSPTRQVADSRYGVGHLTGGRKAVALLHRALLDVLQSASEDVSVDECGVGHRLIGDAPRRGRIRSRASVRRNMFGPSGGRLYTSWADQPCRMTISQVLKAIPWMSGRQARLGAGGSSTSAMTWSSMVQYWQRNNEPSNIGVISTRT
jgi:hypothetical protein